MQVQAQRSGRESTNTMRMLQGPTNLLTEYMLKTFVETFVQPALRLVMLLEQHYESDMTLISLAGDKAQVFKKYGVSQLTDAVLDNELNITVNVGMGATDPGQKMQRFAQWLITFVQICKIPPPGIDLREIWKEGAGLAGYQDGARFLIDGANPEVMKLQQQVQQLTQKLMKGPEEAAKVKHEANEVKVLTTHETNVTKLKIAHKQGEDKKRIELFKHVAGKEMQETEREGQVEDRDMAAGQELGGKVLDQQHEGSMAQGAQAHEGEMAQGAQQHEIGKMGVEQKLKGEEKPQKLERDPAIDQLKQTVEHLAKGEERLAQAIADLAQSIASEHERGRSEKEEAKKKEESKPRTRKGKARLPSGGEMEFEMTES